MQKMIVFMKPGKKMKLHYNIEIIITKKPDVLIKYLFFLKIMSQLQRFLSKNMHLGQNLRNLCKNRATQEWFQDQKGVQC